MGHSVRLTLRAYDEIDAIVDYIARDSPINARRWRDSILADIESLTNFPNRHAIAPEAELAGVEARQMVRGNYRVLYTVESDVVTIHGVRHGARRPLRPDELPGQGQVSPSSGRIDVAGLSEANVGHVCEASAQMVRG